MRPRPRALRKIGKHHAHSPVHLAAIADVPPFLQHAKVKGQPFQDWLRIYTRGNDRQNVVRIGFVQSIALLV
jgi:hypothetical protein